MTYVGELEQMVLWAVHHLAGEGYGAKVIAMLEERVGRRVTPGALFTTVDRLEAKGLVTSRLADPDPVRGGRRKRYLALTDSGFEILRTTRADWLRLWEGSPIATEGL